jgi:hypothetical protein
MAMNLLLALTGPPAMSALWSLTGGKRTWQGKLISVAIDPTATSGNRYFDNLVGNSEHARGNGEAERWSGHRSTYR